MHALFERIFFDRSSRLNWQCWYTRGSLTFYSRRLVSRVGGAARAQAIAAIEKIKVGAAVLDIGVVGENCAPLCRYLSQRGVQFLFYSGYTVAPDEWGHVPIIRKPASREQIVDAV